MNEEYKKIIKMTAAPIDQIERSGMSISKFVETRFVSVEKFNDTIVKLQSKINSWIDINQIQPKEYAYVLWYCQGGMIRTGRYYSKEFCDSMPDKHSMKNHCCKYYGNYGRYAEPAGDGYIPLYWTELPEPPELEEM